MPMLANRFFQKIVFLFQEKPNHFFLKDVHFKIDFRIVIPSFNFACFSTKSSL